MFCVFVQIFTAVKYIFFCLLIFICSHVVNRHMSLFHYLFDIYAIPHILLCIASDTCFAAIKGVVRQFEHFLTLATKSCASSYSLTCVMYQKIIFDFNFF